MSVDLTSKQCDKLLCGYIRANYSAESEKPSFPIAIIALITSFFNLWQHFSLTDDQVQKLQVISPNNDVIIPFHTFWIRKFPIQLRLKATLLHESSACSPEIKLKVEYVRPDGVRFIGGYFFSGHREPNYITFQYCRSVNGYLCEFKVIKLSETNLLSDLGFFFCCDIRQIKFVENETNFHDLDTLPPLKGKGRQQWSVEEEQLEDWFERTSSLPGGTEASANGNWKMYLYPDPESGEIHFQVWHPFVPLDIEGYRLKVTGKCTIEAEDYEGEAETYYSGFGKTKALYWSYQGVNFYTGIARNVLSRAYHLKMEIEWEIVAVITKSDSGSDEPCHKMCDINPNKFGISIGKDDKE